MASCVRQRPRRRGRGLRRAARRSPGRHRCSAPPSAPAAARRDRFACSAGAVEVEPARPRRRRRLGIDGDDLEVHRGDARRRRAPSRRLCVPIIACRPPATGAPERRFAPGRALLERARGDDEVVELDHSGGSAGALAHKRTSPRMQLTLLPPIQTASPPRATRAPARRGRAPRPAPPRSARARGPRRSAIAARLAFRLPVTGSSAMPTVEHEGAHLELRTRAPAGYGADDADLGERSQRRDESGFSASTAAASSQQHGRASAGRCRPTARAHARPAPGRSAAQHLRASSRRRPRPLRSSGGAANASRAPSRADAHQADAALLHDLAGAAAARRRGRARRGSCRASDGRRTAARRRA